MIGANRTSSYPYPFGVVLICAAIPALLATGCSRIASIGTVQIQFYSPTEAAVAVRGVNDDSAAIVRSRGPLGDRLETFPDDLAVFDLAPGAYPIAYAFASGAVEAVIYGQIDIYNPTSSFARKFCQHSFVPIRLPNIDIQEAEHRFPVRDLSYTVGLEGREFEHLKQGDLITKVYFVADLERVEHERDVEYKHKIGEIDRKLIVLGDKQIYLDSRYENERLRALQRDPEMNVEDKIAYDRFDLFGIEESFITVSKKRQALAAEREELLLERNRLENERARRNALLRSLKIIHRDGALVLATPDLQLPYRDSVAQASDLGEIVAVVRIGGRHQYWAESIFSDEHDSDQPEESDHDDMPEHDMAAAMQP